MCQQLAARKESQLLSRRFARWLITLSVITKITPNIDVQLEHQKQRSIFDGMFQKSKKKSGKIARWIVN
jgi:hypothetical protein